MDAFICSCVYVFMMMLVAGANGGVAIGNDKLLCYWKHSGPPDATMHISKCVRGSGDCGRVRVCVADVSVCVHQTRGRDRAVHRAVGLRWLQL